MTIETTEGIIIFCLPSYAKCGYVDKDIEDLLECPLNNFDDDGDICVPELCEYYTEGEGVSK